MSFFKSWRNSLRKSSLPKEPLFVYNPLLEIDGEEHGDKREIRPQKLPPKNAGAPIPSSERPIYEDNCPICGLLVRSTEAKAIMNHIDECLSTNITKKKENSEIQESEKLEKNEQPTLPHIHEDKDEPVHRIDSRQQIESESDESEEESPFAVVCPYTNCGKKMEASNFYAHAFSDHSTGRQTFACPICCLIEDSDYRPSRGTNLLRHLKAVHPEFENTLTQNSQRGKNDPQSGQSLGSIEEKICKITDNEESCEKFTIPSKIIGYHYLVDTIQKFDGTECTICFEEFQKGDIIARMECFCIYHKKCIDPWLKKAKRCPIHRE